MSNPFRTMTPAEMLQHQLDKALRDRIANQATLEEFQSNIHMLNARIARIRQELQAMNSTNEDQPR